MKIFSLHTSFKWRINWCPLFRGQKLYSVSNFRGKNSWNEKCWTVFSQFLSRKRKFSFSVGKHTHGCWVTGVPRREDSEYFSGRYCTIFTLQIYSFQRWMWGITTVSLALRLMISSTINCATERNHAGMSSREPNFYSFLRMPSATGFTNTSFRRRGVVCYDDHQI